MHRFELSSVLPAEYLEDLEALMFFNPQQPLARTGILQALERYGAPRISVENNLLRVSVGTLTDVQTLFALADVGDRYELAGLVLFFRTNLENILVLHIAVAEQFSSSGPDRDSMLAMRLLQAVRDVACHLKGVRSITVMYPADGVLKMPARSAGSLAVASSA
jgi:hypothetical protein